MGAVTIDFLPKSDITGSIADLSDSLMFQTGGAIQLDSATETGFRLNRTTAANVSYGFYQANSFIGALRMGTGGTLRFYTGTDNGNIKGEIESGFSGLRIDVIRPLSTSGGDSVSVRPLSSGQATAFRVRDFGDAFDLITVRNISGQPRLGVNVFNPVVSFHVVSTGQDMVRVERDGVGSYDLGVDGADKFTIRDGGLERFGITAAGNIEVNNNLTATDVFATG